MQRRNVKLFRFFRDLITDHTFVVSDQAELLAGDLLHRLRGTLEIGDLGVQARDSSLRSLSRALRSLSSVCFFR